jgi:hypothetical protein
MIRPTIEQRRRVLVHSNALESKRQVEHKIALVRQKYLDAMHHNDEATKRLLNIQYNEKLLPEWRQAAEAERNARAQLESAR